MKTFLNMMTLTSLVTVAAVMSACGPILPHSVNKSQSKWTSFDDAKGAFDAVKVGMTTDADLRQLGFDAEALPNIRTINYVDVAGLFGSAFTHENLPDGVKSCLKAKDGCYGYVARVQNVNSERNGNVAADLFGFKKQTHVTGWEMQATMVLVDKVVVHKMWSGTRAIDTYDKQTTPLGPMQNLGGIIPKPF